MGKGNGKNKCIIKDGTPERSPGFALMLRIDIPQETLKSGNTGWQIHGAQQCW